MPESSGGGQSPEDVALKLLYVISWGENIDLEAWGKADRKWILDTYAECLQTVKDPAARLARSESDPAPAAWWAATWMNNSQSFPRRPTCQE